MKKLNEADYFTIKAQWDKTPDPNDGSILASGEHMILISMLNSMGYLPNGRSDAVDMAGELLSMGWNVTAKARKRTKGNKSKWASKPFDF